MSQHIRPRVALPPLLLASSLSLQGTPSQAGRGACLGCKKGNFVPGAGSRAEVPCAYAVLPDGAGRLAATNEYSRALELARVFSERRRAHGQVDSLSPSTPHGQIIDLGPRFCLKNLNDMSRFCWAGRPQGHTPCTRAGNEGNTWRSKTWVQGGARRGSEGLAESFACGRETQAPQGCEADEAGEGGGEAGRRRGEAGGGRQAGPRRGEAGRRRGCEAGGDLRGW